MKSEPSAFHSYTEYRDILSVFENGLALPLFSLNNYPFMTVDETKLRALTHAFLAENTKLNLSAFRTEELAWTGNILDSLAFLELFETLPALKSVTRIADMGTGGGFPLLPLALCLPHVSCTGIDSIKKKLDAVSRIVDAMDMKNVTLLCGRLEEFGHTEGLRASFDLVTARALAEVPVLLEYATPLLKVGGYLAFWKSDKVADELASSVKAQKILGVEYVRTFQYTLGPQWGTRTILIFKKTRETPGQYPRGVGEPKKSPL